MKKILLIAFVAIGILANAQETFNLSMSIDPNATIKENSPNVVLELELSKKYFYIKATTQMLPALEGGYIDYGIGTGINLNINKVRLYTGGRMVLVSRGGYTYPLIGAEAGFNIQLSDKLFIGLRATADHREDFNFWGGTPEIRKSGFIRIGIIL